MQRAPNYSDSEDDLDAPPAYSDSEGDFDAADIQCTQCDEVFQTEDDMMDHKEIAENHEYCRKHNLDFESWEEHGIHRVNSRGHWTCDVCYTDFKSQSGLTVHRTQQHKDAKVVSCPACKQTFKGGNAGLTMHIEGNKCQGGITRGEMHQRAQAMQHGRALTHSEFSKTEDVAQQFKQRGVEVPIPGNDGNNLNITFDKLGDYFKQTHDKFVCPCGSKFAKKQGFWQHLQSPAHHAAKKVICFGCNKQYSTTSAMIQHQESGSCIIQPDDAYHSANLVTGGLSSMAEASGSGW